MFEKMTQQAGERLDAATAAKNNPANAANESVDNNAAKREKETKPVFQTYIYRSYGGGYQGL